MPLDLEKAARDFPDLNFIVYHSGYRGTGFIARGSNPVRSLHMLGQMIQTAGADQPHPLGEQLHLERQPAEPDRAPAPSQDDRRAEGKYKYPALTDARQESNPRPQRRPPVRH
jgi:hypothetical protein